MVEGFHVLKGPSSAEGILHGKRCSIQIQIRNPWNTLWEFCMLLKIGFGIVPHIHNKKTTMYQSRAGFGGCVMGGIGCLLSQSPHVHF
jgi:hypothetical protein